MRENFAESAKAVFYPTHPHLSAIGVCLANVESHKISMIAGKNAL